MNDVNLNQIEKSKKQFSFSSVFFITAFFSVSFLIVGIFVGKTIFVLKNNSGFNSNSSSFVKDEKVDFSLFWQVWDLMEKNYVDKDKLDSQKMLYGAINGMLMSTGDQHTAFLSKEQLKILEESLGGNFEGIGAEIGIKDNILTVIAPLKDSPAMKSGLLSGDKIVKINGENTENLSIDEAVSKIKGKKGTEVVLNIFRKGEEDFRDIKIIRDEIKIKSVEVSFVDNVAHLKLMHFGKETMNELDEAIGQIQKNNKVQAIILDMRGNPGGYLGVAVQVSSKFLAPNSLVVFERDSQQKERKQFSEGRAPFLNVPVVVLIDEGSASASEIVAGALRDNRKDVVLVGEKSYGKGSVQNIFDTADGTAVKITIEKWFTPNGDQIHEKGIEPNVKVEMTVDDYKNNRDPQLNKAIEIAKEKVKEGVVKK